MIWHDMIMMMQYDTISYFSLSPWTMIKKLHAYIIYICLFNGYNFELKLSVVMADYKNPLHLDVVDRYLRRMGDKTIPDEAPPSLESFYPP